MRLQNLHAVLVHESRECVFDLVRNLHHLDPASKIVLYNGGPDDELLRNGFPWENYGAVVHPTPKRMKWGWLHDFALDCMRFGFELGGFDTMTIVDSDQMALRAGYSEFLRDWLAQRSGVGLLGSAPPPDGTRKGAAPPALRACQELDLWRPLLRRFEGGEAKFAHWTFWPSTVFTADAARALLDFWPDRELQEILKRTQIWASEEVILPTLVALLGFSVEVNPCRHDYVRYRVRYTQAQLDAALANSAAYWVHPIARRYDEPLRAHLRHKFGSYEPASASAPAPLEPQRDAGILRTLPILNEIRAIEGWLSDDEADLLIAASARALRAQGPLSIVEVGSYCGKATIALARVAEAVAPSARICAVDLHDGVVGSRDGTLQRTGPTREKFLRNLLRAGVAERVDLHEARARDVAWDGPIHFLLVDGLHDYASVAADFGAFARWLTDDGYVAFHDYADYFPGVKLFVDELLHSGRFARVCAAGTLVVLRRVTTEAQVNDVPPAASAVSAVSAVPTVSTAPAVARLSVVKSAPLVSCIMPTADRRRFVPHAIRHFLAQDYRERELVIVDDGCNAVDDLVPEDPRIRYIRLSERRSVGEKRNIACRASRGTFIAHWDDDDWSATSRLSYQLEELERNGAAIAGLDNVNYHDPASGRSWQYCYPKGARSWVAGNTLVYRKSQWERHPFTNINVGEDARFVWGDRSARICAHAEQNFFVAMLHPTNVGRKQVQQRFWRPLSTEVIRAQMRTDFDVYAQLFIPERSVAGQ